MEIKIQKKHVIIFLMYFLLNGCAVAYEQAQILEDPEPRLRRFVSMHQLQRGLSSAEARAVLGEKVIIGYEMPDTRKKHYKPIVKTNPNRVEKFSRKNKSYTIEYYLVGIDQSDGKIKGQELTPLVFKDGELIGWGWDFLGKIKGEK